MHSTQTGPGCGRVLALFFALAAPAAADPSWWSDPSFSIWTSTPQNVENGAPVNLGQLKNVADQARRYLDSRLGQADGAGAAVTALCQFTQADNYAPATVGQLKNVAKVFYDRLGQIGYNWQTGTFGFPSTPYPWTGTINAENQAPCNLGQLKNLFTFEISPAFLAIDGDGDGLPAWWETLYGFDPLVWSDANIDSDLDGLNDGGEYFFATNPHLIDTDGDEASDAEEGAAGTDPKMDTSTPLAFCYLVHRVNWSVNYLPPDPPNGGESPNPVWFDGSSGYWPRQGDHQGTVFANCYPGRDRLGDFYRVGGTGGPKTSEIPIFSSQIPLIPDKDPASAIILDSPWYNPVNLHSEAYFRGDGEGSVYTEAMAVWIRGPKRASETTYLIQVTKTQQQRAPVPPTEEVTYETIVIPPDVNSSPAKSYIAALSGASAQRDGGESTHLRLDLIPVDFITPAGDPVNAPLDAGNIPTGIPDGANEFTFSKAAPGVLTMKLKAQIPGLSAMPAAEQEKFTFELPFIGISSFEWAPGNVLGIPTINGDFITATATYTGLPQNNTDFGLKIARVKFEGNNVGEAKFEVFFPRDEKNHPGNGAGSDPNWYYYWGQVAGGTTDLAYGGHHASRFGYYDYNGSDSHLDHCIIYDKVVQLDNSTGPKGKAGMDCFGQTVTHERKHHQQFHTSGFPVSNGVPVWTAALDSDTDWLSDSYEDGHGFVKTKMDTDGDGINDLEEEPIAVESNWANDSQKDKDWANPGKNKKP